MGSIHPERLQPSTGGEASPALLRRLERFPQLLAEQGLSS
jgi:hypothetical protein